jgi:hypothetical protein
MNISIDNKMLEDKISVSIDDEDTEARVSAELADPVIQKNLVWKLDSIVMPLLGIIYFTHSLDRGNLGNAKTDGLESDLGLVGMRQTLRSTTNICC